MCAIPEHLRGVFMTRRIYVYLYLSVLIEGQSFSPAEKVSILFADLMAEDRWVVSTIPCLYLRGNDTLCATLKVIFHC